ncbi:MAG: hypothetical protein EXS05_14335 [Planctomycetaceae bacterium]|nr:hypothetical protein [Planctomycetaceae bacterium]
MRLYLDDDIAANSLLRMLRQAGHDVFVPAENAASGRADPVHLTGAINDGRVLLTGNHDDFEDLHYLIHEARGHHSGIFVVRRDNDPRRDMTPRGIVTAIKNLEASGLGLTDEFHILNHWR